MSSDLQWMLVKNNHSFLVKRKTNGGVQFSSEPNNLMNLNTFKFSGLANAKAVGVSMNEAGKIVLTTKRTKNGAGRKPKTLNTVTVLTKHNSGKKCRGAEAVRSATQKSFYRADLSQYAVARYHALNKSKKLRK